MEDKCSQMTLAEAPAAEEQQGLGPRIPLLSPSSLLAAKPRRETQHLIFPPTGGTDLMVMLPRPCTLIAAVSFTCSGKGPLHGAAQSPPHRPSLRDPRPPPTAEEASRAL